MKKYWLPLAALPAILLLSIVRQIPFPDFPASRISATQTAPALPVSANSTPENPSSPETVPAPLFPDAEILASREIPFSENRLQRLRLLRVPSEHSPIRVEEIWTMENSAASPRLVSRHAMLAGQILLQIDESHLSAAREVAQKHGYSPRNGNWTAGRILLDLDRSDLESVPQAIDYFSRALGDAVLVAPDHLYFPSLAPNDPRLWEQWAFDTIHARQAWDFSTGSPDVVVAVIDSGAMLSHPDLVANLNNRQKDFVDGDNFPDDSEGHGTHVAGIVGATGNNFLGVAGASWQTGILPLRVGDGTFSVSRIADALDYVVDLKLNHGVNIVATNNSYGGESTNGVLLAAIEKTRDAGILFIAASGNTAWDLDTRPSYPASYTTENIITVAATTNADLLYSGSNYGTNSVHLAAPGANILSTTFNGDYGTKTGTSMAAPFVAGAVALIASAAPEMTWQEIKSTILATVDPLPALHGKTKTGGRLNLHRALRYAVLGAPRIEISSPPVPALRLANSEMSLHLQAGLAADSSVSVIWNETLGENKVAFSPAPDGGTFATFSAPGDYILRAQATVDEIAIVSDPLFIRVGPGEILTPNLAGFWKLDDNSGNLATDSSGQEAHGTLLGNVSWTAGQIGNALHFDGTNSRVDFQTSSPAQITISAWVRSDSPGPSIFPRIIDGPEHILFFGRAESGLDPANRGTIKFLAAKTGTDGVWYSSPHSIGDGEWLHVAATYDGNSDSNTPAIYLNGEPLPVSAQIPPIGNRAPAGTSWSIGNDAENSRPWDGLIDEVRIYDRILSPAEIRALAREPASSHIPAAVFETPVAIREDEPAEFRAIFPAEWSSEAIPSWTVLSGPTSVAISDPTAASTSFLFPESGIYTILYETENHGIRLAKFLNVEVDPALPPLHFELTASHSETIRDPAFPVAIQVTANQPVSAAIVLDLELSGDAQPVIDFQPFPLFVEIPAGETSANFPLIPSLNSATETSTLAIRLSPENPHPVSQNPVEISFLPHRFSHWENYFASTEIDSADGFPALLKYALGLSPTALISRDHPNLPRLAIDQNTAEPHLTLTFRRPAAIGDLDYISEFFDPANAEWQPFIGLTQILWLPDGFQQITIHDPVPLSATNSRLIRLKFRLSD